MDLLILQKLSDFSHADWSAEKCSKYSEGAWDARLVVIDIFSFLGPRKISLSILKGQLTDIERMFLQKSTRFVQLF